MEQNKLRVLMVEDAADDAELILAALREGGFDVDCLRIETAEALQNALASGNWNIVLSDYNLPRFSAEEALSLVGAGGLDVPFIIVSGCIGEEAAVALLKAGAHDFVMKGSMARLVPAVQRGLLETETRRQFNLAQTALQKSEARFRAIAANLPGVVYQCFMEQDGTFMFSYMSDGALALFGLSPAALQNNPASFPDLILPEDKASYAQSMAASAANLTLWHWEGRIRNGEEDQIKWINLRASPRKSCRGSVLWDGIMADITHNKLAEIEVKRSREQLAELTSYLHKVKEQERATIAREIHDDIGGTLTAIKCDLLWCTSDIPREPRFCKSKAAAIESLLDKVIDSTRRIAMDLRPGILDCGIVAAIKWQAKEFSSRAAIPCEVFCRHEEIVLDPDRSVAIFRIFQEVLTNISKYADASKVRVKLAEASGWVELEVSDNGRGITIHELSKPGSFGIRGMQERCRNLRGSVRITGTPGKGTQVAVRIPVDAAENGQTTRLATTRNTSTVRRPGGAANFKNVISAVKAPQSVGDSDDSSFNY